MSTIEATPLSKWKHGLIVAGLAAAGTFISSLVNAGFLSIPLGAALGTLVGEALTYEHSA